MNFYPFHIGDYTSHTAHLELLEDLAYRRLLDLYYTSEKPLPSAAECSRLIRMKNQLQEVESMLCEFFIETPAGWINTRADAEIAKMQDKRNKARASIEKRWSNARNTDVIRTYNEGITTNTNTNTNKEQKQKKTTRAASASLSSSALVADGLSEQEASDYLAHRKAKRAPLTQTAWDGIKAEAHKAKLSASAVAVLCTQRGWIGFDSTWMSQHSARSSAGVSQRDEDRKKVASSIWKNYEKRNDQSDIVDVTPAAVG
jgi:uncharacterized protein YdaU (DUF1376 family)